MELTSDLALKPTSGERDAPFSRLVQNGIETDVVVPGAILEAQFRVGDDLRLIFTTDDCPYEEVLHILLLDHGLNVVDDATVGAPYSAGIVSEVAIIDEDTLAFAFHGGDLWHVKMPGEAKWSIGGSPPRPRRLRLQVRRITA